MYIELYNHLNELKYRLYYILFNFILLFTTSYLYYFELFYILVKPLIITLQNISIPEFIFTNINELFNSIFFFNLFITFNCSLPFIFFQLTLFALPGLYKFELKKLLNKNLFILFFIYFSQYIFYKYIIKIFCFFFLSYKKDLPTSFFILKFNAKINEYLTFLIKISLIYYLSIFIPFLIIYLFYTQILTIHFINKYKKILYFILLIFYSTITPPDLITLCFFIIPIIFSIEIFLFYFIFKKLITGKDRI